MCLALWIALTGSQLFIRPIVGLADNGDFAKVLGRMGMCSPNGVRDAWSYVYPKYVFDVRCNWDSQMPSSEIIFPAVTVYFSRAENSREFDVRAAGALHFAVMLVVLAWLFRMLHERPAPIRFGLPPLLVLIFADTAYVAPLNSFFMDTGSMLFLCATVVAAVAAILRPRWWTVVLFGLAAVLLATSKSQRIPLSCLVALLAIWLSFRQRRQRWLWLTGAAAVFVAVAAMNARTIPSYRAIPIYDMVFNKLTKESADPTAVLAELGLPASDAVAVGTHSYSPDNKLDIWRENLLQQTSFSKIGLYYFHHPRVAWSLLAGGMAVDVPTFRAAHLGNREKEDGFPPYTQAHEFDYWTRGRSWLAWRSHWHIPLLYAICGLAGLACIFRADLAARWPLYPIALFLTAGGITEYCFALLADCLENARHLTIFQVITEVVIVFVVAGALSLFIPAHARNQTTA